MLSVCIIYIYYFKNNIYQTVDKVHDKCRGLCLQSEDPQKEGPFKNL